MNPVLGIDIAKLKFDVAILKAGKFKTHVFNNNRLGFEQLLAWLQKQEALDSHACMEATGVYGEQLANYLYDHQIKTSVVNPAQIKGFAQSELLRIKTDKSDAKLIARFCLAIKPHLFQPAKASVRQLQTLVRRLDALTDMQHQEANRLAIAPEGLVVSVERIMTCLKQEIELIQHRIKQHIEQYANLKKKKALLESIPGVGEATIARVLAFLDNGKQFKQAKQLAAFVGLNPKPFVSGSSVKRKTRLSKTGNARLRCAFYMPAVSAMQHNPVIKAFCQRLKQKGKANMAVLCAAMRKLLHIIYGVLKSGKPFDPSLHLAF